MSTPVLGKAGQAEILRASQKDQFFVSHLAQQTSDLVLSIVGPRVWMKWRPMIEQTVRFTYILTTTVSNYQTLGEEYTGILLVNSSYRALPSRLARIAMAIIQCYGFNICSRLLSYTEQYFSHKESVLKMISRIQTILSFAEKLNIFAFYANGAYYHLSKRFTRIRYASLRTETTNFNDSGGDNFSTKTTFRMLSYLSLASLCAQVGSELWKAFSKKSSTDALIINDPKKDISGVTDGDQPRNRMCPLCLDVRKHTSATPCGHLFCWYCILKSVVIHPECPICRQTVTPSRIVYLHNYI